MALTRHKPAQTNRTRAKPPSRATSSSLPRSHSRTPSRTPVSHPASPGSGPDIPRDASEVVLNLNSRTIKLTNLKKPFWPEIGITKGDLLRYYLQVSPWLIPHLEHRAMVMKRYPNGAAGPFFFQKRAPENRPDWLEVCSIEHASKSIIDFPIINDLAALLWTVNLGCIDLNPWYARCDDVHRPDYLHFDLDPVEGTPFERVREAALLVHQALNTLKMSSFAKTTGSRGIHIYVSIKRGPLQKDVWQFAKRMAQSMEHLRPDIITAEYRVAKRPKGRVLVDYNQNAWGRTLSSIYSVRPKPLATVSTPVTWDEIRDGIEMEDFRLDNVPERLRERGDLWAPLLDNSNHFDIQPLL